MPMKRISIEKENSYYSIKPEKEDFRIKNQER